MWRPVVPSGWIVLLASMGLAVGLAACGSSQPTPDLPGLYNQSAQYHGPERNPVIVIPGLLCSLAPTLWQMPYLSQRSGHALIRPRPRKLQTRGPRR